MKPVKIRKVERALVGLGYEWVRTQGSHRIYRRPTTLARTTVPFHGGGDVTPGTMREILVDIGLTWAEFQRLL